VGGRSFPAILHANTSTSRVKMGELNRSIDILLKNDFESRLLVFGDETFD